MVDAVPEKVLDKIKEHDPAAAASAAPEEIARVVHFLRRRTRPLHHRPGLGRQRRHGHVKVPGVSLTERERQRLAPEIFRLPVDRIRDGYYSDAYFNHTKLLLETGGPPSARADAGLPAQEVVLGGIDEAIAVLKVGAGRQYGGRRVDRRLGGTSRSMRSTRATRSPRGRR